MTNGRYPTVNRRGTLLPFANLRLTFVSSSSTYLDSHYGSLQLLTTCCLMYGGWCAGVVTEMIPLRVTLSNNLSVTAGALSPVTSVWPLSPGPGWAHQHRILQESSVERQLVLPRLVSQCPAPCVRRRIDFPASSTTSGYQALLLKCPKH